MNLPRGACLLLIVCLPLLLTPPSMAQPEALVEALRQGESLIEVEAMVQTEVVVPPGTAVVDGWLELTSLVSEETSPLTVAIPRRHEDDDEIRLTPELPNGPAVLCYGAEGFAITCQETYLYRGPVGDYLGPLEAEIQWNRGTPIRGQYVSRGLPIVATRVALVPADLRSSRAFTMPLGATDGNSADPRRPRLVREVLGDEEGEFQLPETAPGDYFLETLLPTGRLHRSATFSLPERRLSRGRLAASDTQEIYWDLGTIEVLDGASLEVRVQSTTGEMVAGARITARQGRTAEDLSSFQATTDAGGIAQISGFEVGDPMQLSCSASGFISRHEELSTVPALFLCDLEPMAILSGAVVSSSGNFLETAWVSLVRLPEPTDDDDAPEEEPPPSLPPLPQLDATLNPRNGLEPPLVSHGSEVDDTLLAGIETSPSRQVDQDGSFTFLELRGGRYEITAAAPGHEVLTQEVELLAGEDHQLGTLRLMAGRQVDLLVVDAESGVGLEDVLVRSLDPPGAVDGITDEDGELVFTTRSERGLVLSLEAEGYAEARRHLSAEELRQDRPLQPGPIRLELERPGWVRVVIFDEALAEPCRGCTVILTPPGLELRTDEVGHVLSPPLEPGSYRIYRPRVTHLGSTVVEQADAERRYAKVKAGKTSLVRFGEERQGIQLTFDPDLPSDWSLRTQTPYHAERIQQRRDGSFWVQHRQGEALDLYLLFYDRRIDKMSEVRLGTLPADLSVRELELELRRSAVEGRLTDWEGRPLVAKPVHLATLDRVVHAKVWTDQDGRFLVPHAPEGVFGLHVGQRNMRFISVSPAQTVDVGNIQLEPGRF